MENVYESRTPVRDRSQDCYSNINVMNELDFGPVISKGTVK